jgi:hypothetical protein
MIGYVAFILTELLGNGSSGIDLFNNNEMASLILALDISEDSFISICKAISCTNPELLQSTTIDKSINNNNNNNNNYDLDNDLSWFFDDDVGINPIENQEKNDDNNNNDDDYNNIKTTITNDMWTIEWFAKGLQHCSMCDYESNYNKQQIETETLNIISTDFLKDVSLPMRLAMITSLSSWTDWKSNINNINSYNIENLLKNSFNNLRNEINYDDIDNNIYDKCNIDNIFVHLLPGYPVNQSIVKSNAIIFPVFIDYCISAINTNCFYKASSSFNNSNINNNESIERVYDKIVIIDGDMYDEGERGEGSGASAQASSIQHTFSYSNIEGIDINKRNNESNYLIKCVNLLNKYQVKVVFCLNHYISQELIDSCSNSNITIFPLHRAALYSLASMTGIKIVSDILEISDRQIKCNISSILIKMISFNQRLQGNCDNNFKNKSKFYTTRRGEQGDISKDGTIEKFNIDNNEELIIEISLLNNSNDNNILSYNTVPISIILSSPTELQSYSLLDKFYRCLYRIRSVIINNEIMPGGGIPELLCHIQLNYIIKLFKIDNYNNKYSSKLSNEMDYNATISFLLSIQKAFISYLSIVNTNAGVSWFNSLEIISSSHKVIINELNNNNNNNEICSPINILENMTRAKIFSLKQPIDIRDNNNIILDSVEYKIESFKMAIFTVKQLLGAYIFIDY